MTTNGTPFDIAQDRLPDYLLILDDTGKAHLTDRHGHLLMNVSNPDTLKVMLGDAGASYQIIDPRQRIEQTKGLPNVSTPN